MGRYYHLVNTFFHERKNDILISREARKVFGNAEKEEKGEIFSQYCMVH
jgi:lipoate-protein ligase A